MHDRQRSSWLFKVGLASTVTVATAGWSLAPTASTFASDTTTTTSTSTTTTTAPTTTITQPSTTTTVLSASANPVAQGASVTLTAHVVPTPSSGTISFFRDGKPIVGCQDVAVDTSTGNATCGTSFQLAGRLGLQAYYTGANGFHSSSSNVYVMAINLPAPGFWLVTSNGMVVGSGAAQSMGNVATSASSGPVVGIAPTPSAQGYWVATSRGEVKAFGDAQFYGDLPSLGLSTKDVVAIAPTADGKGYYLVGADGGFFTFGDAKFHGSVPGIGKHVHDVVGMVATPTGGGYLLVGADGGVFSFGKSHFFGSLPGLGKHVKDIRAILPSATGGRLCARRCGRRRVHLRLWRPLLRFPAGATCQGQQRRWHRLDPRRRGLLHGRR